MAGLLCSSRRRLPVTTYRRANRHVTVSSTHSRRKISLGPTNEASPYEWLCRYKSRRPEGQRCRGYHCRGSSTRLLPSAPSRLWRVLLVCIDIFSFLPATNKHLSVTSGLMKSYSARIPAPVCSYRSLFFFQADTQKSLCVRSCAHLFSDALYHRAAASLFRDMGYVALVDSAAQAAPSPHFAVAPPRHYVRIWDTA